MNNDDYKEIEFDTPKNTSNFLDNVYAEKSFFMLGQSLPYCYNCLYCRLTGEGQDINQVKWETLPSEINPYFTQIPVAVNLFYGDPLIQMDNTIKYLHKLEKSGHTGPVVIITKGDFSKFPDIPFNLNLHVAFSTFGKNHRLDGNTMERFTNNLAQMEKRKNNYKYSIEFRPIIYNINDDTDTLRNVIKLAKQYNLCIGYSGLQGKPSARKVWQASNLGDTLRQYPGYQLGVTKPISAEVTKTFRNLAKEYDVPIFIKTSCLISYMDNMNRDYNAHYYRPAQVNCTDCKMHDKCMGFKANPIIPHNLADIIPFKHRVIEKKQHECPLITNGRCKSPSAECRQLAGHFIELDLEPGRELSIADYRLIKWLTGMMPAKAPMIEYPRISKEWCR